MDHMGANVLIKVAAAAALEPPKQQWGSCPHRPFHLTLPEQGRDGGHS